MLDGINKKIMALLQSDGRMTNAELAEKTGLSPASTLERVKKLERSGVITGYAALADPEKLGLRAQAFVSVSMASHNAESMARFAAEMEKMDEVLEVHHVAGSADYLLKVVVADIRHYEQFVIEKLTTLSYIGKIRTSFVLSTLKQKTALPIH
jgi:Lrp/AsnC family leucine-responsive transcriptional regulator